MTDEAPAAPDLTDLLADAPSNWGKWGEDDEVGSLNYLTSAEVLRGVASVRSGEVFTLQVPMGSPGGDPVWPGRERARGRPGAAAGDMHRKSVVPPPEAS